MKASELSNSKYLKQGDIAEPMKVTITDIKKQNVAPDNKPAEYKGVMFFEELDKPLVLNQTNIKRCVNHFGTDDMDNWLGKQIVIYVDPDVEMGGDIVGGVRLRGPKTPASKVARVEPEADIPF